MSGTVLPPQVRDLARRMGAARGPPGRRASLTQSGHLRTGAGGRWMGFTARQWIGLDHPEFCWRARVGPFGLIQVRDALIGGRPDGAVGLIGLPGVNAAPPGASLLKGELLRYLAELPWAPDAIVSNPALEWTVGRDGRLTAAASVSGLRAEVAFTLGPDGLVCRVEAGDRPRLVGKTFVETPWRGAFGAYREVGGRRVPFEAEVGWRIEGIDTPVWRGRLQTWSVIP